jgi:hypothetical protein
LFYCLQVLIIVLTMSAASLDSSDNSSGSPEPASNLNEVHQQDFNKILFICIYNNGTDVFPDERQRTQPLNEEQYEKIITQLGDG